MSEYFKNKFRAASIRLSHWDYTWPAIYYVTICTKNRNCCLGEIINAQVYLSKIGKIVFAYWLETKRHFDFVEFDDWLVMPNHLHGIIVLEDNDFDMDGRDMTCRVSTVRKFGYMQPKSLSSVIQAFKASIKRECNKKDLDFQWQANYYEHIIRDEKDYARIKAYIANNPINWQNSKNNPINFK